MAEKELRKLNRRELLQMLLVQCEETERLQQESEEIKEQFAAMSESYERLKGKLNVKDERLNQKDAAIVALKEENERLAARIEELKQTGAAGPAAEAAERIGAIFREAQRAAERYLTELQKGTAGGDDGQPGVRLALPDKAVKKLPLEQMGKIASLRKKQLVSRTRQTAPVTFGERAGGAEPLLEGEKTEYATLDLAAGSFYG